MFHIICHCIQWIGCINFYLQLFTISSIQSFDTFMRSNGMKPSMGFQYPNFFFSRIRLIAHLLLCFHNPELYLQWLQVISAGRTNKFNPTWWMLWYEILSYEYTGPSVHPTDNDIREEKKMEFVSAAKMNKILKLFGSVSTLMVVDSEWIL